MWNWLLVKLGLRTDWRNPDLCPPAFDDVTPHEYSPHRGLPCCEKCGGGKLHAIHRQNSETPPDSVPVHPFVRHPGSSYCLRCGTGKWHSIHTGAVLKAGDASKDTAERAARPPEPGLGKTVRM